MHLLLERKELGADRSTGREVFRNRWVIRSGNGRIATKVGLGSSDRIKLHPFAGFDGTYVRLFPIPASTSHFLPGEARRKMGNVVL